MKFTVEESDVRRGAEFVTPGGRHVLIAEGATALPHIVHITDARISCGLTVKDIAASLNRLEALPLWLHAARQARLKQEAQLSDD